MDYCIGTLGLNHSQEMPFCGISQKRWFLWITLWLRLQEKLHSFQIAMEAPNKDPYIDHITETTALISLLRLSVLDTTLTLALCLSQLAVPTLKK